MSPCDHDVTTIMNMTENAASPVAAALQEGLALHRQGKLTEARSRYEFALRAQPRHFPALHLLGLLAFQSNDPQRALNLIDQAILVNPRSAAAHHDRGNALLALGQLEAAIVSYETAIALAPDYADAYYNRGNALLDLGRNESAVASFDAAIALQADHLSAHNNRGLALAALGRQAAALASFDAALRIFPGDADAHHFRGNALRGMKDYAAAVASYDKAIALKQGAAEIHNSRGSALAEMKQYAPALASYDQAIALRPDFAEAHCNRANALSGLEHWAAALAGYAQALAIRPDFADAHFNAGNVHRELENWDAALASYDKAIAVRSDHAQAHCNRGLVLQQLHQFDAALYSYRRAIDIEPDHARARVNQSMVSLLRGDFEQGWTDYEWRWQLKDSSFIQQRRNFAQRRWRGSESLAGKTLLLYGEQGYGDTLQFCRYVKLAADLGARVILDVPPPLRSLAATLEGVAQVVAPGDSTPEFDFHSPLMSLPLAFGTTLSTVPATTPYLKSNADKQRFWSEMLGKKTQPRVGLVWSGGTRPGHLDPWWVGDRRNIPLAKLASLSVPDIEFHSLQKGQPAESELVELAANRAVGFSIANFTHLLQDFSDTAALIEQLDLVISVDTAVVHLAGALGKPVWILNRFDTCWRWLLDRTDSPWYPTARIYRQERLGDWDAVLLKVSRDLAMLAREMPRDTKD